MTAETPLHTARLAGALAQARYPRRRRGRGVLGLMLLLLAAAMLLSLAVMFLPLSHPQMRVHPAGPHSQAASRLDAGG